MAKRKASEAKTTKRSKTAGSTTSDAHALPDRIFAQASPRSVGGVSLFAAQEQIRAATVQNFFSERAVIERAASRLREAGFEILQISPTTINIAGSADTYQRAFGAQIVATERPVLNALGAAVTATFLDAQGAALPGLIASAGTAFEDVIEGVAIEEPRTFMAASMFAPAQADWQLHLPGDISLGCNADRAHRTGITGRNIKVAVCDSGWVKHAYFIGRGYRVSPVVLGPGAANPLVDESGHGTGAAANIFAVAPDVTVVPVKLSFVNTTAAFNTAAGLRPDIITCSWGSSRQTGPLSAADQALAAAIALAVAAGIIVICAAGNGHWGFPGQHPDVLSAGGALMSQDGTLQASRYASGFTSNIYSGRRVPDLAGLVGAQSNAPGLMLPSASSSATAPASANAGWTALSGTSAAASQLAGAVALVKQANPGLRLAGVREVLMKTARDVTAGSGHPNTGGTSATVGPDSVTGNGLLDAHKAVLIAKVRGLAAIRPAISSTISGDATAAALHGHYGDATVANQFGHFGDATASAQPGHYGDATASALHGHYGDATVANQLGHFGDSTVASAQPGHYGDATAANQLGHFGDSTVASAQPGHYGDSTVASAQPGHIGDPTVAAAQPGHIGDPSGATRFGHYGDSTVASAQPGHIGDPTVAAAQPGHIGDPSGATRFGHYGDSTVASAQPGHIGDPTVAAAQPGHIGDPSGATRFGHYGDPTVASAQPGHIGDPTVVAAQPGHIGDPAATTQPRAAQPPPVPLAPEDLAALEDMVANDEIDLDLE